MSHHKTEQRYRGDERDGEGTRADERRTVLHTHTHFNCLQSASVVLQLITRANTRVRHGLFDVLTQDPGGSRTAGGKHEQKRTNNNCPCTCASLWRVQGTVVQLWLTTTLHHQVATTQESIDRSNTTCRQSRAVVPSTAAKSVPCIKPGKEAAESFWLRRGRQASWEGSGALRRMHMITRRSSPRGYPLVRDPSFTTVHARAL